MANSDSISNSEIERNQKIKQLMQAAIRGKVDEVKEILQQKIEVDAIDSTDPEKNTALHLAAENGQLNVVRFLLNKGADPMKTRQDENGRNAFHLSAGNGHTDIVALILERAKSLDINKTGKLGMTALYRAATNGHMATVRLLLFYGADPNKPDLFGMTASESAALSKHLAIVKLLKIFSAISFCVKEEEVLLDAKAIQNAYVAKTGTQEFSNKPLFEQIFKQRIEQVLKTIWELHHLEIRQNLINLKVQENDLDPSLALAKDLLKDYIFYKINRKLATQI
jgi:ankyrin repeat protein